MSDDLIKKVRVFVAFDELQEDDPIMVKKTLAECKKVMGKLADCVEELEAQNAKLREALVYVNRIVNQNCHVTMGGLIYSPIPEVHVKFILTKICATLNEGKE